MKENFREKDYYLHRYPYEGSLKFLREELEMIEESGKKTLWYYSGKETLRRLKKGRILIEKGIKGGLSLTPYDFNNIVYALLKKLER
jgi:ppGpp synthetase/RelA/SpoT-type nucleotidyltranferase